MVWHSRNKVHYLEIIGYRPSWFCLAGEDFGKFGNDMLMHRERLSFRDESSQIRELR